MKVFALLNGCYSDQHIVGIYSSMAHAQMAGRIFQDDAHIEVYDLDAAIDKMFRDYKPYFVRLDRETGDILDCSIHSSSYGAFSTEVGEDIQHNLYTYCWAEHDAHAVKIAGERRRMFLASERR